MILSRSDYKFFLKCDEIARFGHEASLIEKIKMGERWKFNVLLRKYEYNYNVRKGLVKKIITFFLKYKRRRLARRIGWYIEPNCFGPGLCVVHNGPVIINGRVRFGANCRIQSMVNIGANNGSKSAPCAGNNIYIGPGAKIFGDIRLGNNIAIGANAVVNKSFERDSITLAGVPAKIVANHGCEKMVIDAIGIVQEKMSN